MDGIVCVVSYGVTVTCRSFGGLRFSAAVVFSWGWGCLWSASVICEKTWIFTRCEAWFMVICCPTLVDAAVVSIVVVVESGMDKYEWELLCNGDRLPAGSTGSFECCSVVVVFSENYSLDADSCCSSASVRGVRSFLASKKSSVFLSYLMDWRIPLSCSLGILCKSNESSEGDESGDWFSKVHP